MSGGDLHMAEDSTHLRGSPEPSFSKGVSAIRRDVKGQAQARPGLTELYKRAGYLMTLIHDPSTVLFRLLRLSSKASSSWCGSVALPRPPPRKHILPRRLPASGSRGVGYPGESRCQGSGVVTGPGMVVHRSCHVGAKPARASGSGTRTPPFVAT